VWHHFHLKKLLIKKVNAQLKKINNMTFFGHGHIDAKMCLPFSLTFCYLNKAPRAAQVRN